MKIEPYACKLGKHRLFLHQVPSTMEYARQLLEQGNVPHGTWLSAFNQYQGKGRKSNVWNVEAGRNITGSMILQWPPLAFNLHIAFVNVMTAVAVRSAIQKLMTTPVLIKWPNDILIKSKKVSGILVYNQYAGLRIKSSILGIGINVHQTNFPSEQMHAASLIQFNLVQVEELYAQLFLCLEENFVKLTKGYYQEVLESYNEHLWKRHQFVQLWIGEELKEGKLIEVTPEGKISIELKEGLKNFDMDEIKLKYT